MADIKKLHNKLNIDGEEYLIQASGAAYLDADIELTIKSGDTEWGNTAFGSEDRPTATVDISGGAALVAPLMDNDTAAVGTADKYAREDHVHPTDTTRAPNNHADASDKYGLATIDRYGHAKSASAMPLTDSTSTKGTGGAVGTQNSTFALADHVHPRHEHLYASSASEGGPADSVKATHKIAYTKVTGDNNIPAANNFNKTYNGSSELTVTIPTANGTALTAGFISGQSQKKLDEIEEKAEVNQNAYTTVKVGKIDVTAQAKTDTLSLVAGDNIDLTPVAAERKITISTPSYTADEGVELDGDYNFRAALKAYTLNTSASNKSTATNANRLYPVELDKNADLAVAVPWTDNHVTEVGKHYTPTQSGTYTASASSTTSATWGTTDFVTGVTLNKDAAGHITGVSVDSIQLPANPNTAPTFSGTEGVEVAKATVDDTQLSIHDNLVEGKINYRAALRNYTANTAASTKSTSTNGGLYAVELDKDGKLAVRVPWTDTNTKVTSASNHYSPSADSGSQLSVDASSSTAAAWNSTSLVTGVNIQRDSKGHVTGVTVDSIKMPANPDTNTAHTHGVGAGLTLSGAGGTTGETTYTLKTASTSDIGGVKTGFTTNNTARNYAVQLDANNKAYVNVPWEAEQTADVYYGAGDGITMSTNTQGSNSNPHLFSHADTSSVNNVTATGINVVNAVTFDGYGHVTGFSTRNLPTGDNSTPGVTLIHNADDCTSYTSDSNGAVTPAAVRKAITNFADFQASSSNYGVVKIGYSTSGRKDYAVQLDSNGKMFVNVPWEDDTNTTYTVSTGDGNGQIKVTPSSGSAYNVDIKGLGSAAYTESSAYATAGHGHSSYALTTHNHDSAYAAKSHSHSSYAPSSHSHSGYLRGSISGSVLTITIVS